MKRTLILTLTIITSCFVSVRAQEQAPLTDQQLSELVHQGEVNGCQNYLSASNARAEQLRRENERLKKELADLKTRLDSNAPKETSSK